MELYWIGVLALLALERVAHSDEVGDDYEENEIPDAEERIVGGQPVNDGRYPWTVALYLKEEFICTASIISTTDILTAAHCVNFDEATSSFHGVVGSVNRSTTDPSKKVFFRSIQVHKDYNEKAGINDIALMELTEPLQIGDNVQPICIAPAKIGSLLRKSVVAMGWGGTGKVRGNGKSDAPDVLRAVDQTVILNLKCDLLYLRLRVPSSVLCARGFRSGVCYGDSGGPLVYFRSRTPIQVGIASYVHTYLGCGRYLGPAGFTRLSSFNDFVMNTASGKVCIA